MEKYWDLFEESKNSDITDLQEKFKKSGHGIVAPVNVIRFRKSEEEASDDESKEFGTDEEILARFKADKAKYDSERSHIVIDRQKDDEYVAEFYGVDRRSNSVDRQVKDEDIIKYYFTIENEGFERSYDEDGFTSDDEDFIAKFVIPEDEASYFEEKVAEQVKYIGSGKG